MNFDLSSIIVLFCGINYAWFEADFWVIVLQEITYTLLIFQGHAFRDTALASVERDMQSADSTWCK